VLPEPAAAHGLSGRASLPVPSWLFAWAAAIVLVVSFVALSTLWSSPKLQERKVRRICRVPIWLPGLCGLFGLALFALVIYAGYEGVDAYTKNFDPTFIYVIFWVGVPVTSALTGDWFGAFSPWRTVARIVRWSVRRMGISRPPPLTYPRRLGRWPVVAGLVANADPFAILNVGTLNTLGGNNGSATRRSTLMNPASASTPMTAAMTVAVSLPSAAITA
jgi:hypothetical protein